MKRAVLLAFFVMPVHAADVDVGKDGLISRIGDMEISFGKVGVLHYDTITPAMLSAEQVTAINKYFARMGLAQHDYRVMGKKIVGDFILFVFEENHVADGGIDLVYSINAKEVIGWYVGGIHG